MAAVQKRPDPALAAPLRPGLPLRGVLGRRQGHGQGLAQRQGPAQGGDQVRPGLLPRGRHGRDAQGVDAAALPC